MEQLLAQAELLVEQGRLVAFGAAFVAGVISAFSPCVLAAIPLVIGYVGGYSEGDTRKSVIFSLVFIVGLSTTFTAFGALAAVAGQLLAFLGRWLVGAFCLVAMVMGLMLMGVIHIELPFQHRRDVKVRGLWGALLLGLLTGAVSSPCATPVLAVILAHVSTEGSIAYGTALLFTYAVGHCALIFLAGISTGLTQRIISSHHVRNVSLWSKRASGLVIFAVGLYTGWRSFV